jgi:cytochrome c oxidase cbb3-type subunit 3
MSHARRLSVMSMALLASLLVATRCGASDPMPAASGMVAHSDQPVGPIPGPARAEQPPNPLRDDAAARQDGRRLFVSFNCSGCHGGHAGGGMGPSLRDEVWLYGGSDAQIFSSIAQGRANGMPAWGSMLPEDQIWRITAYVTSLRTPQEAEPPR